jgi:hypothetical protein
MISYEGTVDGMLSTTLFTSWRSMLPVRYTGLTIESSGALTICVDAKRPKDKSFSAVRTIGN